MKRSDTNDRRRRSRGGKNDFRLEMTAEGPRFVLCADEKAAPLDAVDTLPAERLPVPRALEGRPALATSDAGDDKAFLQSGRTRVAPPPSPSDDRDADLRARPLSGMGDLLAAPPPVDSAVPSESAVPEAKAEAPVAEAEAVAPVAEAEAVEAVVASQPVADAGPAVDAELALDPVLAADPEVAALHEKIAILTRGRDGRYSRPASKNKRRELEMLERRLEEVVKRKSTGGTRPAPAVEQGKAATPPPQASRATTPPPQAKAATPPPQAPKAATPPPQAPKATAPPPQAPKATAPPPQAPKATAPPPAPSTSNLNRPLVVDAPILTSPAVISSVVSDGKGAVKASYMETSAPGVEVVTAPIASPPRKERKPLPEARSLPLADPTPRDMVERVEPPTYAPPVPGSGQKLREPFRAPAVRLGGVALVVLLVAVVGFVFTRARQGSQTAGLQNTQPGQAVKLAKGAPQPPFRRFDSEIEKHLTDGEKVVLAFNDDGTVSNKLIFEPLYYKDLKDAIQMARIKAESLERPLVIVAKVAPDEQPIVVEKVMPSDQAARREYMLTQWQLKQHALRWSRDRYLSRDALDPRRTVNAMAAFIEKYPDSRYVGQALEDMRHVTFVQHQDPAKFREVMLTLLDKSFQWAVDSGRASTAPELARVIGPYLQEAMNQLLYQRIHRLKGNAVRPAEAGGHASL